VIEAVVAVKVAVEAAAATVTDEGTMRTLATAPAIATMAPPVGAAFVRVTVQVVLVFEVRVPVAHCSEETSAEAESARLADVEEPFSDAVTVAV